MSQSGENYPPPPEGQQGQPQQGQGYGQQGQGYGQPQGQYGYGQGGMKPRNGLGVAALVLGILSIFTSVIFIGALLGILAIILGFIGRGRAKRREATNGGVAVAGIITGILGLLITVALVAVIGSIFSSGAGKTYQSCVKGANQDQAKIQQCAQQFGKSVTGG